MPNWCSCDLKVVGQSELVADFMTVMLRPAKEVYPRNKDADAQLVFDFNAILPCPDVLRDIVVGDVPYYPPTDSADKFGRGGPVPADVRAQWIAAYGADNWYDWHIKHWDTKWNASDTKYEQPKPDTLVVHFETAWSPPSSVIAACAARWPGLKFTLDGYERGMGYQDQKRWVKGKLVKTLREAYHGERGG